MPGGDGIRPLRFFLHNSQTPVDIKKKLSDFNFTPLTVILRIFVIDHCSKMLRQQPFVSSVSHHLLGRKNKEI